MEIPKSISEKVAFHKQRPHRIEALADGVFAIVMTLLVLDIRIPLAGMNTENSIWHALLHTLPKILTFILSFSIAGLFWSVLANQFNYVHASDRCENIIVIFYLMFVSLLPFSTSFLSEHILSRIAVGFYILNILVVLLINMLHWLYSYHYGLVQVEGNQEEVIHKAIMRRARTALIANGIVGSCCFFSSYLALCGIIFLQLIFTFSGFIELLNFGAGKRQGAPVNIH